MLYYLSFLAALFIGLVLGVIGSGGSILTLPILVYMAGVEEVLATAYSLFIVGITALIGTLHYWKKGLLKLSVGFLFGLPALIAVLITRAWIVPAIPAVLWQTPYFKITKGGFIMLLFALFMLLAAFAMLWDFTPKPASKEGRWRFLWIMLEGIVVGVLTGLVGAGGGFLIVPALVLLVKLPVKEAIATSLFIIVLKSLVGFIGDVYAQGHLIQWKFLLLFSIMTIIGIFIGTTIAAKLPEKRLKKLFAYFVLLMAVGIFIKEIF